MRSSKANISGSCVCPFYGGMAIIPSAIKGEQIIGNSGLTRSQIEALYEIIKIEGLDKLRMQKRKGRKL